MHVALIRTGAPSAEPITLAEAKAHLHVDGTADDALIAIYMTAAREAVEGETGRCLMPTDWEMWLPGFPPGDGKRLAANDGAIEPWHVPLVSVLSLKTANAAGTLETLSASTYQVIAPASPTAQRARILPAAGTLWPTTEADVAAPVRVAYRAGYTSASEVPAALRAAVLLILGDLYANREAASVAKIVAQPAVERLLAPYRLFWG